MLYNEDPDYAALETDIRQMLFDQGKFDELFSKALVTFYQRLASHTYNAVAPPFCERIRLQFVAKAKAIDKFWHLASFIKAKNSLKVIRALKVSKVQSII